MHDLTHGRWRPGGAISVKDVAERLHVSPTPVREALERLVGTGMVSVSNDRNGFIMPRLGMRGFMALTDTFCLLAASTVRTGHHPDAVATVKIDESDPVATTVALFDHVLRRGGNDVTAWLGGQLGGMLAPYRLAEPQVIPSWSDGMLALRGDLGGQRTASAIRRYARTRHTYAARLVDRVEQGA